MSAVFRPIVVACSVLAGVTVTGCESGSPSLGFGNGAVLVPGDAPSPAAPVELASVDLNGHDIVFWPYTGARFDGTPVDPINLVFVGDADPVQIRAALLSLDGNRPGLPVAFPFTGTWDEATGDVQTGYGEPGGWTGSVIQLQLGAYDPVRFHLRLFRAGDLPDGSVVTLGAAHFELLVPNTSEHQVLSWELAEQIVVYDMARTGLLVAPPRSTGLVNQAPDFREIPDFIYNGLPEDLVLLIGGSPSPVAGPVAIPSDGAATVLALGVPAEIPGETRTRNVSIVFNQVVPKPFCSDGPFDWVLVTGTVDFTRTGSTDPSGEYAYSARYEGVLLATPVDITRDPPVPVGEPFTARVQGDQEGVTWRDQSRVQARDMRLASQDGGMEFLNTVLRVSSQGGDDYREHTKCLGF